MEDMQNLLETVWAENTHGHKDRTAAMSVLSNALRTLAAWRSLIFLRKTPGLVSF
jgi:hypothetical protein